MLLNRVSICSRRFISHSKNKIGDFFLLHNIFYTASRRRISLSFSNRQDSAISSTLDYTAIRTSIPPNPGYSISPVTDSYAQRETRAGASATIATMDYHEIHEEMTSNVNLKDSGALMPENLILRDLHFARMRRRQSILDIM